MKHQQIITEVNKAIVGKENQVRKIMMAFLAGGHVLLEDMPGVGKTTLANAFSKAMGLETKRLQFTPDVLPSDVVGFTALDQNNGESILHKGAVFCNLFLADEINRTSSRTQSALLEVMEENQITVDGTTYEAMKPFYVIATQNPYGSAGTQMLPESQLDRFMIVLSLGYPDSESEIEMLKRKQNLDAYQIHQVVDSQEMLEMCHAVDQIYAHDDIISYIVSLVHATRHHPKIIQGASPRASICLIQMAKAAAYLHDRDYIIPEDVHEIFFEVMGHRIHTSNSKQSNREETDAILSEILQSNHQPSLEKNEKK